MILEPTPFLQIPQDFDFDIPFDFFSSDHFRMFEFKIRRCPRGGRSHDWTRCPFAHPGEKARRRDPRKIPYSATPCPDFRHSTCKKGDSCDFSHGVFECWLHPSRYRTHLCNDLNHCRRRVCFFAHSLDQLRVPTRPSQTTSSSIGNVQVDLNRVASGVGSPRGSVLRPGFSGMQKIPTWARNNETGPGSGGLCCGGYEIEVPLERVESGRDLRAKIYAKLTNETSYGRSGSHVSAPDFGWVSELVK